MIWLISRYENGKKITIEIEANSFDEAIKKAREIHNDFNEGQVKK